MKNPISRQMGWPVIILFTTTIIACNSNSSSTTDDAKSDTTASTGAAGGLSPVETKEPNTNYKPAFAGQTRIGGIKTNTPYEGKVLSSDLKFPWSIAVM